jgi:2-dehydro-3-deoxygalactonokinase
VKAVTRAFLSCDWGTSSFRLRAVEVEPFRILSEARLEDGAEKVHGRAVKEGRPAAACFREVLARVLAELGRRGGVPAGAPVVISGMASSSIGWKEVPYASLPFPLDGSTARWEEVESVPGPAGPHRVFLLSGLAAENDVMRGEETEAMGCVAGVGDLQRDVTLILPGTHSKHIDVEDGAIVGFTTYMTGELLFVLANFSILRHSCAPMPGAGDRHHSSAFRDGVLHARERALSGTLFAVRANDLLHGVHPEAGAWFLSGVLVGTEVIDALERSPREAPIVLCAEPGFAVLYTRAVEVLEAEHRFTSVPPERVEKAVPRAQGLLLERLLAGSPS